MATDWREHVLNNMLPRMEATGPATGFTPGPMVVVPAETPFSGPLSFTPQFDPLETLPPAAQEKLRALRLRSAESHAVVPQFESIREASMAKVEAANSLKRLTSLAQDGGFNLGPDDRRVIEAQRLLDKATDDFQRIQQRSETKTAAWHAASAALASTETWLRHGKPSGVQFLDWDGEPPKLIKGEAGLLDAVENRRRRVRELRSDLNRLGSAPYPSAYAKQRMREQIEALAQRGAPDVSMLIEHDGEIIWPTLRLRVELFGAQPGTVAYMDVPDTVGMNAWRHKSEWIAALDREIDTESDDPAALTHEARAQAEAEVQADLLDVERQEAALTWQAQQQGLPCEHRADISPVALLGLRLVTAPRSAPPPTSPEHGYNIVGGRR